MLKILQARLQQYVNWELPDVQAGFRKGRGTRDQLANIYWILEEARELQKIPYTSVSLTILKPLTVDHSKLWKILKKTSLPASWETCMQVKRQQLKLDMEQKTGSKLGKKYVKAIYCHPDYLTYMQSISCEMLAWMKHKPESKLLEEI